LIKDLVIIKKSIHVKRFILGQKCWVKVLLFEELSSIKIFKTIWSQFKGIFQFNIMIVITNKDLIQKAKEVAELRIVAEDVRIGVLCCFEIYS